MFRGLFTLYGVLALLLQLFVNQVAADVQSDAKKQRQQLIDQHGLLDAEEWQNRCQSTLKQLSLKAQCLLLNHKSPNAFAFADGVIMINKGLLDEIKNQHQLAHILAHEQAHLLLNHHQQLAQFIKKPPTFFSKRKLKKLRHQQESEADAWANNHLVTNGFDPHQIHHLWQRLLQHEQTHKSSDHPNLKERINTTSLKKSKELQHFNQ